jgi:hypothetical protein
MPLLPLPQIDTLEHVAWLFARVRTLAGARLKGEGRALPLITMCESGMGLLNLR